MNDSVGATPLSAGDARQRALALMQTRRMEEAERVLGAAMVRFPDDWQLRLELARCLLERDRPHDALAQVHQALVRAPESEWAHRVHALVLIRLSRSREAVTAAEVAVRLAPMAALTHVMLSQALRADRRFEAARDAALVAVGLAPADPAPYESLGRCLLALRDAPGAEEAFRQVLAITPEDPVALNNLALSLQRRRREREATELFARAAALDPAEPLYRRNVGISAGRLTRVAVPIGAMVVVAGFALGPGVAIAVVILFALVRVAYAAWMRRSAVGADGRPLPDGVWAALREHRRERRRLVARTLTRPGEWWGIVRRPREVDPTAVMTLLMLVVGFGVALLVVADLLDDAGEGARLAAAAVVRTVGLALMIGLPAALVIMTRRRR